MPSRSFERFAATTAFASGVGTLVYSAAFLVLLYGDAKSAADRVGATFLMVGGLLAVPVFVALWGRLREADASFAMLGLLLGFAGSIGSLVHGGYDVARFLNPPRGIPKGGLPNAIDPRGLLTFGLTALSFLVLGWLIRRSGLFPRALGTLTLVAAGLLLVIYVGRLTVLDPTNPVLLGAAMLTGFAVSPALYVWVGRELWRPPRSSAVTPEAG